MPLGHKVFKVESVKVVEVVKWSNREMVKLENCQIVKVVASLGHRVVGS